MIVVVGTPSLEHGPAQVPAGRACAIAVAAAAAGCEVEIMGRVGDDPAGDALILALGRAGVGHVSVLRDPGRPTLIAPEPAMEDDALLGADDTAGDRGPGEPSGSGPRLEPADVALGLRYLTTFDVLIVADDAPASVIPACIEAAAFAGARLVVAIGPAVSMPAGLPEDVTVLVAPEEGGEAFGQLLGRYAAALDAGAPPESAFATATDGWGQPGA